MDSQERDRVGDNLQTVMDWSSCVGDVTSNSVSCYSHCFIILIYMVLVHEETIYTVAW
jgi:hypothetical protein